MKRNGYHWAALIALILLFNGSIAAPDSPSAKMGNWYFKQFNFTKAALYYKKALKADKDNQHVLQRLADSYRLVNKWEEALPYYEQLSTMAGATAQNHLYYAEALKAAKKYSDAKNAYKKYQAVKPDDQTVEERIKGIERIQELYADNGLYLIQNLNGVNTPFSEFGVSLHGENAIYFSSNRKPDAYIRRTDNWTRGSFLEIYKADIKDTTGKVGRTALIESKSVNKKFHEAAPCYNERRNELYFDRSNYNGCKVAYSADRIVKLKLYKVGWSADQNKWNGAIEEAVPFNSNEYSVCHPSLTTSGDTLFFTSDMPGGFGRSDIYMTTRQQAGAWGTPVNLGPSVNTPGDEMFPFIANDGTLYFASNGHEGLGGLDVYESKPAAGADGKMTWLHARNLGTPVNTSSDDFGYVLKADNKHGYLCSNRPGGAGGDDIYMFVKKAVIVNGIVYNAYTGATIENASLEILRGTSAIGKSSSGQSGDFTFSAEPNSTYIINTTKEGFHPATKSAFVSEKPDLIRIPMYPLGDIKLEVTVIDKKTRQPLDSAVVKVTNLYLTKSETLYTDKNGQCTIVLDTSTNYRIDASKTTPDINEKYLNVSREFSTKGIYPPSLIKQLMELEKVKIGVPIKLENIYYDLDKWFIRPDAAIELDKLVKILNDNPTIEIELSSHTDCRASVKYNATLSAKRAKSAVEYIASKGIEMKRMISAGYGESKLVNKCRCEGKIKVPCTEEQHQENRRTEFKVIKF